MTPAALKEQFTKAFDTLAADGQKKFGDGKAELSHVCFKFTSIAAYQETVTAARSFGHVTQEQHKGKEITWCKLSSPLKKSDLTLEFLELVEPKEELNPYDGVTSIGFYVEGLPSAVKLPSNDANVIYRYQGQHGRDMAGK